VITIVDHAEGCVLWVRAQPGARKAKVSGEHNGALKIAVTAPPQDGRANDALVELLAHLLQLKRAQVELISGDKSRDKRLLIRGVTKADLGVRVAKLLGA
jgi:uncharacterized protein